MIHLTVTPPRRSRKVTAVLLTVFPADLARRQLVVSERHGQAQIIRFCANVTPRVKPEP